MVHLAGNAWHKEYPRPASWTNDHFSEPEEKLFGKTRNGKFPHIQVIGRVDASHFLHIEPNSLGNEGLISNATMNQRNDRHCLLGNTAVLLAFVVHDHGIRSSPPTLSLSILPALSWLQMPCQGWRRTHPPHRIIPIEGLTGKARERIPVNIVPFLASGREAKRNHVLA